MHLDCVVDPRLDDIPQPSCPAETPGDKLARASSSRVSLQGLGATPIDRRHVFYSGRVQGVGFRATVHHLASGFDVAGWVRNLPDGRVEVLAEGEAGELSAFLAAIAREMGGKIRGVDDEPEPPGEPPLSGFSIRF